MTRFIGLTGGIGAGKSTALAAFKRAGAPVLSTDELANELLDQPEMRRLVTERWGERVLSDGHVDRDAVARIVFGDRDELLWLESELHPRVGQGFMEWRAAVEPSAAIAVVEVPLLFESGMAEGFDATVAVIASDEIRDARLRERGQEGVAGREARQLSQDEKAARADHVIRNDGSLQELDLAVRGVIDAESAER